MSGNVTSHCLQQQNKNMVELSGTGVPPSLLGEVQERRSGASRGPGAAFRLVPAEIKHCHLHKNVAHFALSILLEFLLVLGSSVLLVSRAYAVGTCTIYMEDR